MNILLTGASGFVGGNLALGLADANTKRPTSAITATYRTTPCDSPVQDAVDSTIQIDLCDKPAVEELLRATAPELIIHCAALAQAAACEKDLKTAIHCNVDAIRHLTAVYQDRDIRKPYFIYMSTDLVFDGTEAPVGGFSEDAQPKAASSYAQTKLAGEGIVQSYDGDYAVLRLALVYGNKINGKQGFLGWLADRFTQGQAAPLFVDEWRTPVSMHDITACIEAIIAAIREGQTAKIPQLLHLAGSERLNRVQFAEKVSRRFGYDEKLILPQLRPSSRSADVSLCSKKLERLIGRPPLDVSQGLSFIGQTTQD